MAVKSRIFFTSITNEMVHFKTKFINQKYILRIQTFPSVMDTSAYIVATEIFSLLTSTKQFGKADF